MNFKDKVVVVTGASSGIGRALVEQAANKGASVVYGARGVEQLEELHSQLTKEGHKSAYVKCDVTKEEDCKALIDKAVETFGRVDILICNAGISMRALFNDVDLKVLHSLMDVNFWGTVYTAKYALPWLLKSKGSIVGVSSVAGMHGLPARTGYSASKYAMVGFLETLRVENLEKGLHVMIASPGFIATNVRMHSLTADGTSQGASPREEGKMMSAEEAALRILKGVSGRKREVIMDFQGRATKFIKKFAPALLDRLFFNHMKKEEGTPL